MKRRTFLKTVGGATGATALGLQKAQSQQKSSQARATPTGSASFVRNHTQHKTYGIGKKMPAPSATFNLSTRMPGWFPDACDPTSDSDYLFPEEMLRYANGAPEAFSLPTIGSPTVSQILGGKPPKKETTNPFALLIRALADKARMYNITLYELRRFHYCKKFGLPLPPNPYGNQPALPACNAPDFDSKAQKAETNFTDAAKALDNLIDSGGSGIPFVAVDMVHVNNYIVSMRVVAVPSIGGDLHVLEVGGSSSSHVSIYSAFSSPRP